MSERPLAGLRVIDAATLAAGPLVATALGEFGPEDAALMRQAENVLWRAAT